MSCANGMNRAIHCWSGVLGSSVDISVLTTRWGAAPAGGSRC